MSSIYENKSEMTLEKYLYQCNTPIGKKAKKNLSRWKASQLSGMIIVLILSILCFTNNAGLLGFIAIGFMIVFAYNLLFKRKVRNTKMYKKIIENCEDGKWYRTITFDKDIKVSDGNIVTTFKYTDFVKFGENDRYYFIYKNENAVLRVEKGAFIKGDEETFARFMQNKIKKNVKS